MEEWMDLCLSKGINIKWNANSLFQDLNSDYQIHFLQL